METNTEYTEDYMKEDTWKRWEKTQRRGKIAGGIFVVAAGSLFLAKELGAQFPEWLLTWKTFLIAIGLITGIKHGFRHPMWIVLTLVGGLFLLGDIYPTMTIQPLLWPVLIIMLGLFILFKPRHRDRERYWKKWHHHHHHFGHHMQHNYKQHYEQYYKKYESGTSTNDEYIDSTTFMGGVKKNVVSKNFKGGDITNVLGGAELNLTQADFDGTATLELTNVLGGTKLIIPAHWTIKSELVSVCGSIEDKRPVVPDVTTDSTKVLVLRGNTFMGGVEIKSY